MIGLGFRMISTNLQNGFPGIKIMSGVTINVTIKIRARLPG
jgi:hypothetical protein